ncbi:MAG: response regulator [Fibrobacteres bacterium]|nr:response regulator [Fibrobacterota bacterium]
MARLIIIDDESHIADILTRFFKEKGHDAVGVTQAEQALALLEAGPFDLVITDIAMHGLSGLDLLDKMKRQGIDVPVIVTTGNPSHTSAVQALRGGAFDYVVKPFHLEEIAERAEKALSAKRVKDEHLLYSKLVSLHSISRVTADAASMDELSSKVIKLGTRLTGSDGGWYWVSSPDSDTALSGAKVIYPDADNLNQHAFLLRIARATAEKVDVEVTDAPAYGECRAAWFLSLPVEVSSALHGVLIFRREKPSPKYDAVDLEVFNQLAATFALGIRALPGKPLEAWARLVGQMVDEHCPGYESKGERVEALGRILMKEMNWPDGVTEAWPLVCRIYDIAKVRLPQRLLENKEVLADEDLEFVHAQAAWACERIASIPGLETTARVLEDFQENYDGCGRPRGIKGRAISPLARLLAVADAFISMRSARPYREALSEADAIEVVRQGSGKRFDPEIVLALSKARGI